MNFDFRLWKKVAEAVKNSDHKTATDEKTKIEDNQRRLCKLREESKIQWVSRFFEKNSDGEWVPLIMDRYRIST